MTREEIYNACLQTLDKSNSLLLEAATGTGKSLIAIKLINHLCETVYKDKEVTLLLLVAKRVHKKTWCEEIGKWGGIKVSKIIMECYESLHKYQGHYDIILSDECHHIGSDMRLELLKGLQFGYFIGLSATIPRKIKQYFRYNYHSEIVSCDLSEAIKDEILPEPEIVLMPLQLETTKLSETLELHPKAPGGIIQCDYASLRKYKFKNVHVICKCTQRQKLNELNDLINFYERKWKSTYNDALKQTYLYFCGKRLEFLSDCKVQWVKLILSKLKGYRTITFCKTIEQAEKLGKYCIHSKNGKANQYYNDFNDKKVNHITAVNILNENANLVDCKYGIFCNINGSELIVIQRLGRSLRHKKPVIIFPYYKGTREEELLGKHLAEYNKEYIRIINSVNEL